MSLETPLGFAYPEGTDAASQLPTVMSALADYIDDVVGISASGKTVVNVPSLNTAHTQAVVYPAGRFTSAPVVTANIVSNSPGQWNPVTITAASVTGFTISLNKTAGGTGNFTVHWRATEQSG